MSRISRRSFLSLAAALPALSIRANGAGPLSTSDDGFLEDLSRRAFRFFWSAPTREPGWCWIAFAPTARISGAGTWEVASTALTGFSLTGCCIASDRRWMDPNVVRERVQATLRHFAGEQEHVRGWYFHFVNRKTGERVWKSELSTMDTAILLAGVLTAQQYYRDDDEIFSLARTIYERVDFRWMLDPRTGLLHMGWDPATGLLRALWGSYDEEAILYVLAIGSPTSPIPAQSWYRIERPETVVWGYRFVGSGPLFTHQYSQAWLDLRGLRDGPPFEIDYFKNSVVATYAHRAYCLGLRGMYPQFSESLWGVTVSDSEIGYLGWGRPSSRQDLDGSVVPCASGGSLMFAPEICLQVLRYMHDHFAEFVYGRYGFADAFNPQTLWVDPDVVGIDVGIMLLNAENLRSGRVWQWFNRSRDVRRAIDQIFRSALPTQSAAL